MRLLGKRERDDGGGRDGGGRDGGGRDGGGHDDGGHGDDGRDGGGRDGGGEVSGGGRRGAVEAKKVYLKDASFESPGSPRIFGEEGLQPMLDVQMSLTHQRIEQGQDYYEVVLCTTVTASHEKSPVFLAEVQQAGIFEISHVDEEKVELVLETACPHVLLPFAREALASLVSKGGFPQLLISPINFQALYRQKKAKEAQSAPTAGAPTRPN